MNDAPTRDRLIPLAEVAEMIGVERDTLWSWRHREEGPESFKIGDKVVYRESLLLAWIAEREAATRKGGN